MTEFAKRTVEVEGIRFNLRSGGHGGLRFLLVHGIGVSHRYFLPLARELAQYASVSVVDLPGFGGTPKPEHSLGIGDFARLTLAALEMDDDGGPAVVVGHSMGTQIAIEMARQQPAAVAGVVLLGPTTDRAARNTPAQGWRLLKDVLREPFTSNVVVFTDYLRCGPVWYAKILPAMLNYETENRIREIETPLVVARGEHDPVAPRAWVHQLAGLSRNGRAIEIAGKPHVVMFIHPEAVAQLCLEVAARC
ncbi:alpha/beta fold hydrolase [Arthrobacter sp. H14]|uniref:alpha/beta fold hydrolase n=1 Tax=Arthrobacter sp. H14 TaxID=1312959 RepID=UPI00047DA175|nr:alpha/beta hydrolase [Arthrobacter sp. H14]